MNFLPGLDACERTLQAWKEIGCFVLNFLGREAEWQAMPVICRDVKYDGAFSLDWAVLGQGGMCRFSERLSNG